jgi:NAD(P)-dependent dehydrogenase (short-subunit alcohol dehydrogenase family)
MHFTDKTVVVTGGSRGIGFAISQAFAEHGADVIVVARDGVALEAAVDQLSPHGRIHGVRTDMSQGEQVEHLLEEALALRGRVDALVNNAGHYTQAPIAELDTAGVTAAIDANLVPTVVATRIVGVQMADQGSGSIINISSLSGHGADGYSSAYSAAKAAVTSFTRATALELGTHGVRCNSVSPGYVETSVLDSYPAAFKRWVQEDFDRAPLGRIATPVDVANACLYLASEYASAVTGIDLKVDCGVSAGLYIEGSAPAYVTE